MSRFMLLQLTLVVLVATKNNQAADLNVGTTLFTKADSCKECWSSENLALLTSRMILEDLLPSTSILLVDSNEFVSDLVEYFRLILEIVRHETHGKTKHITLLALTDLLGGYLHHAVLPIAKYAYYAGLIDYDSMATLLGLFDELKWFLRTNGQGWAKPLFQNVDNFEIQRIPLQPPIDKDLCHNLMFVEGDEPLDKSGQCNAIIPMPFFDSTTRPSAIALPTKTCPLHNIEANTSNYLVMKFFVTAYKCLQVKNVMPENIDKFQNDFMMWIEEQILPRLQDETFYAAFGGILRVRNTLKRLCVSQQNVEKQADEFRKDESKAATPGQPMSRTAMILTAVLITIFVWFILGTMFICYKMRQSKQKGGSAESGEKTTTCSSLASSKYFYPEKPTYKKGASSPETETSDLDVTSCYKRNKRGRHHEITITTCKCDHDDGVTPTSAEHTEGRLPSITEISESASDKRREPSKPPKSAGGSTTPMSKDQKLNKVQKQVYMDSDSETEESSEPA